LKRNVTQIDIENIENLLVAMVGAAGGGEGVENILLKTHLSIILVWNRF
jgi:hypothetical protein